MISSVRSFGAPVIEPPGKAARMQSIAVGVVAQPAADGGHELVDRRVGLDGHQRRHVDAAQLRTRGRGRCARRSTIIRFSARDFSSSRSAAPR